MDPAYLNSRIDHNLFKAVLGSFATGVTVITTRDIKNKLFGFTANSFTSVSLKPPLILFCLHNDAKSFPAFNGIKTCAISILEEGQSGISENFAYNEGDKFHDIPYFDSKNFKCPIIRDAHSWLECIVQNIYPAGDHSIFLCRVIELERNPNKGPLVYYSGEYHKLVNRDGKNHG